MIINDNKRDQVYFLADGIYHPWSVFAKTNPAPINEEEEKCVKMHEHARKDIERVFVVLISKFDTLE